jgi:hypothetical protein
MSGWEWARIVVVALLLSTALVMTLAAGVAIAMHWFP